MRRSLRYTIATLLIGSLLLGLWTIVFSGGGKSKQADSAAMPWQQFQPATASIGTKEDPFARRRYDWMRLRDPATGQIPENIRKRELAFAKRLPKKVRSTSTWNRRGPTNIGGRTRALAYDGSDLSGNTILAAGVSGGMWRTTDGGETWTRTFEPGQRPNVTTVVQDTSGGKTNIWYAGTGELIGNSASGTRASIYKGNGVFKSTDGGQTWTQLPSTTSDPGAFDRPFDYVHRVRIDPSNASKGEVYAATYDKIFRSTDGGSSWTAVLEGDVLDQRNFASMTDVAVTSNGVVYATLSSDGDQCGLFRSPNGVNWTEITPSGWPGGRTCQNDYFRTVLDVNPSSESEVWFLSYAPGYGPTGGGAPIGHVLWKYDASTGTWTNYSNYLPTRGGFFGNFYSQRGYDMLVQVHPTNPDIVYAGGVNLWGIDVSGGPAGAPAWIGGYNHRQGGLPSFYEPSGSDPQHPDQHTIAFHPTDPNVMLTGSDGGVHRTSNNQSIQEDGQVTYTSLNNGYFTTQFYHVCMNTTPHDPTIMGGMQDNGTWFTQSSDSSTPWSRQRGADGAECEIVPDQDNDASSLRYASAQGGSVLQYTFEKGTQVRTKSATPPGATGQFFIHPFEIDPANPTIMYYPAGDSLYRNLNVERQPADPSAWMAFPNVVPDGYLVSALRASRTNAPNVLYYGGTDADGDDAAEVPRVYRVDNADSPFLRTEVTSPDFPDGAFPSDFAVDPRSSDSVLVAFSNYGVPSLFYSTNGGETWTNVEGNLGSSPSGPSVRSVSILPQPGKDQTTYYAATSVGLYSTTSLGPNTTWQRESPNGMGNVVVNDVETRLADGQVLAGTHANGVYSSNLPVPAEVADFQATTDEATRGVTLTWRIPEAVSSRIKLQHLYRDRPFDAKEALTQPSPRTYRYEVDSLPAGPHTFRVRQVEGPSTTRTLETANIVIPTEGAYDLTPPAPNPFRQSTSMRLTVKKEQPVRAALYNALGQRVATLLDRTLSANRPIDLRLTGDNLASGVYFVHIRGRTFTATQKVVLVE